MSLSPFVGFGSSGFNFGMNLNMFGMIGDVSYGHSVGGGYNSGMSSLGAAAGGGSFMNGGGFVGWFDGKYNYGAGYSYNSFSGNTAQGVAAIHLQIGQFGLRVDEDYLGDRYDRYRTGGVLATFQANKDYTFAIGVSMITGDARHGEMGNTPTLEYGQKDLGTYNPNYEIMTNLRGGILYGGVIHKGQANFIGHNNNNRLHAVQNYIHSSRWPFRSIATPFFYNHGFASKMYGYSGGYHPNYLFY